MVYMSRTMKLYAIAVVLTTLVLVQAGAIPKKEEKHGKDRVYDKELSDQGHFESEDHNPEYDHEAFLGKDEAKTFDQLTPEESKERLGKIYDKIDKDKDGKVTETELKEWIQYVQKRYIIEDTDRQWKEHEPEGDGVTWEAYKKRTYGFLDDEEENKDDDDDTYKDMIKRDERRWKKADKDGDNKMTKEEFADFLHPEESEHMRDVVVDETLEDIDKDKDGSISLEEYIADMYDPDDEDEPEWIASEKESFTTERDLNKDGKMDREEVLRWIVPDDYDHAIKEAEHLIQEADVDKSMDLTKEEVLEKYDLFVGSQATDFGEALTRHEEL